MKRKEDYPLVLNVKDIMEILGIGKRIAYELMDQQGFPVVRIGRLKKVNRDAFFNWIDQQGKVS
ncbi:MAG: Prophage LambdaBa04, binding protein [Neobacillus sp.]|nr:Prophage LambdaBa04, binding protein [Neobacillus sp.]